MIGNLSPHLPFDDAETTESYLRRLSQFHTGRCRRALLADLDINLRDFSSGTEDALSNLAAATGVAARKLEEGMFLFRPRYREFRGEVLSIEFLRPEGSVICTECIEEDAKEGKSWLMKERILWRLRPMQTCPIHDQRLVSPTSAGTGMEIFDMFALVGESCQLEPELQVSTALEMSISHRVSGNHTYAGSWLDSQTMEQGVKACEMIGATLTHGLKFNTKALSPEEWRQAGETGFSIARNGAEAVNDAISQIAAMSTTTAGQAGPRAVYGRLYEWLAYNSPIPDPGPIRDLLRENILDTLVVEPDEVLLGKRVKARRLHSVYSLSIATRLHQKRLRKILVQAGMADHESWDLAAHRLVFPVEAAEQLCADIVDSVSLHRLPEQIGCSRTQAESLYREGVIRAVIEPDAAYGIGKLAFARREIDAFLKQIEALPEAQAGLPDLIDISSATKRTGCSTGDLMARTLSGGLAAVREGRRVAVSSIRFILTDLEPLRMRLPRSVEQTA
ncbi:TniQ family protein [Marivita sp. GX14005]|uniref:TniQ family protein n=1 Tax=Marivita sp. GX14005 TaxID=2942276 RepID=UPI002019FF76|nr:TniQ family protein [Marivita sp. GX14005]MCL3883574.1 TniQ family protein [Marivita sp. GX14005]